jgi:hypothetical protein
MNKQEFKENMLLLRKQVELLTYNLGIQAEFSVVHTNELSRHTDCAYEIRLCYKEYNTIDRFNNPMYFGADDINKVAVALISSFFADYVGALSLRVNK